MVRFFFLNTVLCYQDSQDSNNLTPTFPTWVKSTTQITQLKLPREVLLPNLRLYATHIVATKAALLNMSRVLDLEKAPGQIILPEGQGPSSHATEVMTQIPETSKDDVIAPNTGSALATTKSRPSKETSSSLPSALSANVFPFFRLPRELRDEIYIYASTTQKVWIGRPPRLEHTPDDVIVEKASTYKPTTLIRTKHSIVSVSHETRDEFRTAVWREYITTTRRVRFRVYDFAFSPIDELFAHCSASEVKKLQKRDKCRMHHHITTVFHVYRRFHRAYQEIANVLDAWLVFEMRAPMIAKQSIDECDWYDAKMLRDTLLDDNVPHIRRWSTRWECSLVVELFEAVCEAYETRSTARVAGRNAFHKLAPLGQ
jgi:hypothetical protein